MSRKFGRPFTRKTTTLGLVLAATVTLGACSSKPDTSAEGQIEYACALMNDIKENSPYVSEWDVRIGDKTPNELLKAMGAASLVGGATAGGEGIPEEMHAAGKEIVRGVSTINEEYIQDGVNALIRECASLED